jgi:murein DD-endopeptidase MepM/ murein hydrolase activator NlpD
MSRPAAFTLALPVVFVPMAALVLFLALVAGRPGLAPASCADPARPGATTVVEEHLDTEQMAVATQIVRAVRAFAPTANKPHAAVIALATAGQESGIRNLDYGDRDSLGAFQQRPSQGWGTPDEIRNVTHATTTFLRHLARVPGWETMPVTAAAATVQRPAEEYRGLYQQWVPLATSLTRLLWARAAPFVPVNAAAAEPCTPTTLAAAAGSVVYPVPTALIGTNRDNWGGRGGLWSSWHTGTDFSVPCGTPVLSANGGTVEIDRSQSWAGPWLVKVLTGPTGLATWYAHMRSIDVTPGQIVRPGQQLGEVGELGQATGCHLHFEVHLHNGSIYGPDNTDPTPWLVANTDGRTWGRTPA